jgi:hypothetical protein
MPRGSTIIDRPRNGQVGGDPAELIGDNHERLVRDHVSPCERLHVVFAGHEHEGHRQGNDVSSPQGQDSVQLGKSDVEADRQTERDAGDGAATRNVSRAATTPS